MRRFGRRAWSSRNRRRRPRGFGTVAGGGDHPDLLPSTPPPWSEITGTPSSGRTAAGPRPPRRWPSRRSTR
ncbi:hypothetical protein ACFFX0_07625 [Citricoccus parietis]|uniref:Uncharacterized protein n=1 Tax=Citricoccus parietis TaxID=592307 RepID=A0ABV5FWL9_9MICC